MKSEYPRYFIDKGQQIAGDKHITDKFKEYFTQIGPSQANWIDIVNKATFDIYLLFNLSIRMRIICRKSSTTWNQISSTGHDNISRLLRHVGDIVAYPLSIIINQSLCTGIFPSRIKLAKFIPLYKKWQ